MVRSIKRSTTAETKTGKDNTPRIAVTMNAQMVNGKRVIDMPLVRRLITVTT